MPRANAETFARIAEERELATWQDIELAKNELRKGIEISANTLRREMEAMKHEIVKWTYGMIAFKRH